MRKQRQSVRKSRTQRSCRGNTRRFSLPELLEARTLLSAFSVTSNADGGPGTLRQAIIDSNNSTTAPNTITFALQSGQDIINLTSGALPAITQAVSVDGPDSSGSLVEVDGGGMSGNGFEVDAAGVTIKGLAIGGFGGAGVVLAGGGATVQGDFVGLDLTGSALLPNDTGIVVTSNGNLIGGTNAADRNVISGNNLDGVDINGADSNILQGNYIGTDATGENPLGNNGSGVVVDSASNTVIGGSAAGAGNLISGNIEDGVLFTNDSASGNLTQGNVIGLSALGASLGNGYNGVDLGLDGGEPVVGVQVIGNVISANGRFGIQINDSSNNLIQGNLIGTDASGHAALDMFGNPTLSDGSGGISLAGNSAGNVIGGTTTTAANIVSGNGGDGIDVSTATGMSNAMQGNLIGVDVSDVADGNSGQGIYVSTGQVNVTGNVISANFGYGVELAAGGAILTANYIGTDSRAAMLGNAQDGVYIISSNNVIGGSSAGSGNVIAFNGQGSAGAGVFVFSGNSNDIRGNFIYSNATLGIALGDRSVNTSFYSPGPNNFQEFPAISTVSPPTFSGTNLMLTGTMSGSASTTYCLDFFSNVAADSSGYGQGQTYLGSLSVTTDAVGNAAFSFNANDLPSGQTYISATATDPSGNTSEFAKDVMAQSVVTAVTASPTLVTTASFLSVNVVGSAIPEDQAVLSGGNSESGLITFTLTAPNGNVVDTETVTPNGDGTYTTSNTVAATLVGTYTWKASFAGDALNNPASDQGGSAEQVTTVKASPSVVTTASFKAGIGNVVGTAVPEDSAALSGGYGETGTLTFTLTAPDGTLVDSETVTANGDGTYETSNVVIATQGGTYTWKATFAGDSLNNNASDQGGTAEQVITVKAGPAVSTQASETAGGVVGNSMLSDTATLSGGYNPTGTITFTLTKPDGTTVTVGSASVNGDGTFSGPTMLATEVGTYTWHASYAGDSSNNGASDNGQNESVTTVKAGPAVSTQASETAGGVVGSSMLSDTATLSGGYNPTGTITFTLTKPDGTTVTVGSVSISGDGTFSGPTMLATEVGTYTWHASYAGDSSNNGASDNGQNESVTTVKAGPAVSTQASETAGGVVGSSMLSDTATLSGGYNPTGTITFTLTKPDGTTVTVGSVSISGDGTFSGPTMLATEVGTYTWHASYAGDSSNNGASDNGQNESVTTVKAGPAVSTQASETAGGVVGSSMLSDTATLSGGYNPTGTITFTLTKPDGTTVTVGSASVNGDGTFSGPTMLATEVGTYTWHASYAGDSSNNGASDNGQNESVTTVKAGPAVSTQASETAGGVVGSSMLSDTATLSGGYNPTGTITFTLTKPDGTTVTVGSVSISGDGTFSGPTMLATEVGTYTWHASYAGDSSNNGASDNGQNESVTTVKAGPAVSTQASETAGGVVGSSMLSDTATLSGGYNPTGTITFTLTKPDGTTVTVGSASVNGDGTFSGPTMLATEVGTYTWHASYAGDSSNNGASDNGQNESVTTVKAGPSITNSPTPTAATLGTGTITLKDAATLSGGYVETGTITFTLTAPSGTVVDTESVPASGNSTYSTPAGYTLPAGTAAGVYQWKASYSGDANNNAANATAQAAVYYPATGIFVLDPSASGALTMSGNGSLTATGTVVVDSNSCSAITLSGNAHLVAGSGIDVVGKIQTSGNASVSGSIISHAYVSDPLAGLTAPTPSVGQTSLGSINLSGNSTATISPGVFNSITVSGNAALTLKPGLYVIAGGGFNVSGNGSVTGNGVTIYNTGSTYLTGGSNPSYGAISLSGNGKFNLSPPASGTYQSILIFQDRSNSKALTISGNASLTGAMSGTTYAVKALLNLSGNGSTTTSSQQVAVVVDELNASGNGAVAAALSDAGLGFSPAQIRDAYGINSLSLDGTGQTIAIVGSYDNPDIYAALDQYDAQFGLTDNGPSLLHQYGAAASFLTVMNQNAQTSNLPSVDPTGGWEAEEELDVEWAHAIAPGAKIVLVEANSQSLSDLMSGAATAASQPGVSVVSMSWGVPENVAVEAGDEAYYDQVLNQPGVSFVASTGDFGTADPEYPAFSPNVVAVGGTSLVVNADNSYNSESGWGYYSGSLDTFIGSGGGTSSFEPEPAWQQGVQSSGNRSTPDVCVVADPSTGAWIADPYNLSNGSPWEVVGGTSLSAPIWAGLLAIVNQGRVNAGQPVLNATNPTDAQQALYAASSSDFNQILSGTNGGYSASAGYNFVTGLGSPIANLLIPDLIAHQTAGDLPPGDPNWAAQVAAGNSTADANTVLFPVADVLVRSVHFGTGTGRGQDAVNSPATSIAQAPRNNASQTLSGVANTLVNVSGIGSPAQADWGIEGSPGAEVSAPLRLSGSDQAMEGSGSLANSRNFCGLPVATHADTASFHDVSAQVGKIIGTASNALDLSYTLNPQAPESEADDPGAGDGQEQLLELTLPRIETEAGGFNLAPLSESSANVLLLRNEQSAGPRVGNAMIAAATIGCVANFELQRTARNTKTIRRPGKQAAKAR